MTSLKKILNTLKTLSIIVLPSIEINAFCTPENLLLSPPAKITPLHSFAISFDKAAPELFFQR